MFTFRAEADKAGDKHLLKYAVFAVFAANKSLPFCNVCGGSHTVTQTYAPLHSILFTHHSPVLTTPLASLFTGSTGES